MKSLKEYSLNLTEKAYHEYPAWSHSLIARYADKGFAAIAKLHEPMTPTPSMEFGSLFDTILTRGREVMDYYTVSDYVPTEGPKKVMDRLLVDTTVPFDEIPLEMIDNATMECSYYTNRSLDSRIKELSKAKPYYEMRRSGKTVVSTADWKDAMEMATRFRTDPYLSNLFGTTSNNRIEYLYQTQFLVKVWLPSGRLVEFKFMPDLLVVNHDDKTVQPVDLKTSSVPGYDFAENFIRFRYDIQAQSYTEGLRIVLDGDPDYADYTILPYLFTDISRVDKIPVTYEYDPMSESQINGLSFGQYTYKNWKTLLDEIIDYEETEAVVPSYIKTDGPNDLLDILNRRK